MSSLPHSARPEQTRNAGALVRRALRRREATLVLILGVTVAVVGGLNPAFVSPASVADILAGCAPGLMIACGLMLVLVTGEIDVSVGSLYALLGVLLGVLSSPERMGLHPGTAVLIVLAGGAVAGLINGVLVGLARVPSIVVTLGMMAVLRGLAELLLGGRDITDLPPGLRVVGTASWLGLSPSVWIASVGAAAVGVVAHRTPAGLRFFAVGDNPEAAAMSGIRTGATKLSAFVLNGAMVGVAVVASVPQLPKVEAGLGIGLELLAISAAVVGGVSVRGGVGTVGGVVLGALLLNAVRPALLFLKLESGATFWERAIQGAFILGAVAFDHAVGRAGRDSAGGEAERGRWRTGTVVHCIVLGLCLVGVLVIAGAFDRRFVQGEVQGELLKQGAELALLAAPMALIMLTGGIDLSVGAIMALSAVVIGMAFERGLGLWPSCGLGVLAGAACGLLNGSLVAWARMHPLIVTLATMALFRGVAEGLSGGRPVSGFLEWFPRDSEPWVVRAIALLAPAGAALALAWGALRFTVPGWVVRGIGFNELACRYAGLSVGAVKAWLYMLGGSCAGVAAVLLVFRRNTAKADAGMGIELDVITAVVLGGVSVSGGRGSIVGVALGVLLLHQLRQFIGWHWQSEEVVPIVIGTALVVATVAGRLGSRRSG